MAFRGSHVDTSQLAARNWLAPEPEASTTPVNSMSTNSQIWFVIPHTLPSPFTSLENSGANHSPSPSPRVHFEELSLPTEVLLPMVVLAARGVMPSVTRRGGEKAVLLRRKVLLANSRCSIPLLTSTDSLRLRMILSWAANQLRFHPSFDSRLIPMLLQQHHVPVCKFCDTSLGEQTMEIAPISSTGRSESQVV